MAEFPALPLWTDAYLGDTTHLTTIEHGAYLLLLMAMWRNNGQLPDDDKLLARYARMTIGQWHRIADTIRAFFRADNGAIFQGRLTDELNAVRQHSKRQSDNVKARWLKTKETVHTAVIPDRPSGNTPLPLPIPSKEVSSEGKPSLALVPKAARFDEFWNVYPHRDGTKRGKKPAEARYVAAIRAGVSEQDIIDGAKRAGLDRRVRAGFARDPTTWLNQDGWQDEIDVSRGDDNGTGTHGSNPRPGPHNALMAGFAMAANRLKN